MKQLVYSIEESAAVLGLGKSTIKKFIYAGKLRSFKVGDRRLISHSSLEEFLTQLETRKFTETPKEGAA